MVPKVFELLKFYCIITLNIGTPKIITIMHPKNGTVWFYNAVMHPNAADGMTNSVDLDQTAPLEAGAI